MILSEIGWTRPLLAGVLIALGLFLRFGRVPGKFFAATALTRGDDDIRLRTARRTGEVLFVWAGWVFVQILTGMPASWAAALWAPLVLTAVFVLSYPARLYARRYLGAGSSEGSAENPPIPKRGGWLWVVLRELVPLSAYIAPILIVRAAAGDLPDRIPVGWTLDGGGLNWSLRDQALRILRHQTMIVYLILILLEGVYLIVRWARGRRRDIAEMLLTRGHWLYFFFRVGWVTLFAGLNLGFVFHAVDGRSPVPYLLPGLLGLVAFGVLLAASTRSRPT